ncbi:hypothetical protein N7448_000827 [Penicillium atrosanguineum]|nr:hypothetical protein N7526_005515 [Penicillium atrosanguineum]KAJ5149249.1 hypothetical protein N7448_000827 [Penicillium atrosanguineum]
MIKYVVKHNIRDFLYNVDTAKAPSDWKYLALRYDPVGPVHYHSGAPGLSLSFQLHLQGDPSAMNDRLRKLDQLTNTARLAVQKITEVVFSGMDTYVNPVAAAENFNPNDMWSLKRWGWKK